MEDSRDISRRDVLRGLGAAGLAASLPATARAGEAAGGQPRIGLALGSGGANGLAHILMLEVIDELGLRVHRLAGASIGALIGALYCSGLKGRDIRNLVTDLAPLPEFDDGETGVVRDVLRLVRLVDADFGEGGLVRGNKFLRYLYRQSQVETFEELKIPLAVVAADFWQHAQVVMDEGDLLPAVEASMALPGLLVPVARNGRVLIDGGTVNPVPYDLLMDSCDLVIAVNVLGERTVPDPPTPSYAVTIFNTFRIMQHSILNAKLERRRPHIYVRTNIRDVRALEFAKAGEIFEQARPAQDFMRRELRKRFPRSVAP